MIVPNQNKVVPYALVVPRSTYTPSHNNYPYYFNPSPSRSAEQPSRKAPTACSRLLSCIGGIIIGMMIGAAVVVPLMFAFHGSINNDESTTIISTTSTILTTSTTSSTSKSTTSTTSTSSSTTSTTSSSTSTTSVSTTSRSTTSATSTSSSTTSTSSTTSSTSTSTSTTTTTNTVAVSLYGVQLNFDPTTLPSGWSQCYNDTYAVFMSTNLISTILNTCNKGKLMLGCRPVGIIPFTVGAMGLRADVLYNCSTISSCINVANGVGWYYSDVYSWGFVNNTDTVSRSSCDTASPNPNYRLCWHTSSSYGGYRCGSITSLNSATNYERVIYHAN